MTAPAVDPRGRRVASLVVAGLCGALFGTGLLLASMTRPDVIIGFLDVTRGWDPRAGFVMGGAVMVYAVAFRWIRRRSGAPWFDREFHVPPRRDLDGRLLAGAALFGIGWGLGGFCPGPGLVAAASGNGTALVFVAAMLAGMWIQHRTGRD
ncbi:MAG TPA: YeeE/YedE family protein [Kofleriaceae bacterium]|nr:YeeE/YedE family protein [Kofleriaceae bacterium]